MFVIDAEGGFEAAIGVPETAIDKILLGMPASVAFPQVAAPVEALITEIGTAAGRGNTFPVKAALIEPPRFVRTGMTTEVSLVLSREHEAEGRYLVPLSTIAPGENSGEGFVFVYNSETSTVRRTVVKLGESLQGNVMPVSGIEIGDILASAGVNFLVDGQEVTLLEPVLAASGN